MSTILKMWDASLLAGSIKEGKINSNSYNGSNVPFIQSEYRDLQHYSATTMLPLPINKKIEHSVFIAKMIDTDKIYPVIAFKGTDGFWDGVNNVYAGFEQWPSGGRVHFAFKRAVDSLRSLILEDPLISTALSLEQPIYLTGHSKGGALATLAARMIYDYNNNAKLHVYTFGSPRVGDREFADYYRRAVKQHIRTESFGDLIPHLPLNEEEFILPNIYTDILIADLLPDGIHQYVSVGEYNVINIDSRYNREGIKPALGAKEDLNAYYVAINYFVQNKNIFDDRHGVYFKQYDINRKVGLR